MNWNHGDCPGLGSKRYCQACKQFVYREEYRNEHHAHWGEYECEKCDRLTGAETLPSYCPYCETWGSMAGPLSEIYG